MYGAFIGDIAGSKYEFDNIKTKDFPFFSDDCSYTDDSVMTAAVARAVMDSSEAQSGKTFREILIETMQNFGRRYPCPKGSYGSNFAVWLFQDNPQPYGSYGNGSAMRVSPCALAAGSLQEALALARESAAVSHNHPEGIKGAEAVAAAVFMAKTGSTKDEIRKYITENYYNIDFTMDSIRSTYTFDVSCQGSVPQAIAAFLESEDYEDTIRNAISIGGDCDTTGAIAGSIAWTFYIVQEETYSGWAGGRLPASMLELKKEADHFLPDEFRDIAEEFQKFCSEKAVLR